MGRFTWDVNKQSYGVWDMGEGTLGMTKLSAILGMQGLKLKLFILHLTDAIHRVVQLSYRA